MYLFKALKFGFDCKKPIVSCESKLNWKRYVKFKYLTNWMVFSWYSHNKILLCIRVFLWAFWIGWNGLKHPPEQELFVRSVFGIRTEHVRGFLKKLVIRRKIFFHCNESYLLFLFIIENWFANYFLNILSPFLLCISAQMKGYFRNWLWCHSFSYARGKKIRSSSFVQDYLSLREKINSFPTQIRLVKSVH